MSASSLATAMSLYKSMLGGQAQYALPSNPQQLHAQVQTSSSSDNDVMQRLVNRVNRLESSTGTKQNKVRYLDDKVLHE